jgi:hypothetical protein
MPVLTYGCIALLASKLQGLSLVADGCIHADCFWSAGRYLFKLLGVWLYENSAPAALSLKEDCIAAQPQVAFR